MKKEEPQINNPIRRETFVIDDTNHERGQLKMTVISYPLIYGDFEKITKPRIAEWPKNLLILGIYPLILMIIKIITQNDDNNIERYEWVSVIVLVVLAIIFHFINKCYPSDKEKKIRKIEKYFIPKEDVN